MFYLVRKKGRLKQVPDGIDSNGSSWYKISDLDKRNLSPFTIYVLKKLGYTLK